MFCGAVVRSQGASEPGADQVDNGMAYCAAWEESTEREGNGEGWGGNGKGWGGGGLYT